jgi:hypothetical protein
MLWLAITAWLIGVSISFIHGSRKLPLNILFLGIIDLVGIFFFGFGMIGMTVLAVLAIIILIANKAGA